MSCSDGSNLTRLRVIMDRMKRDDDILEVFFELSPDLFAIVGSDWKFKRTNEAWEAILGWKKEELGRHTWFDFLHPQDIQAGREIEEVMLSEDLYRFHNRYRARTGHYVSLEWCATRWKDGLIYAVARPVSDACRFCPSGDCRVEISHASRHSSYDQG